MKKLKVWQKLTLMGLVFLIPFFIVTFKLISSVDTLGIEYVRKERMGLRYLLPVRGVLQNMQRHRTFAAAYLEGDKAVGSQLQSSGEAARKDIAAVDAVDSELGQELETSQRWKSIKEDCLSLIDGAEALSPRESRDRHDKLMQELVGFFSDLSDASNLTLDQGLDSYYLIDVTILDGPDTAEIMGQLRMRGAEALAKGNLTFEERQAMNRLLAILEYRLPHSAQALDKAMERNPSLKSEVESKNQTHEAALQDLVNNSRRLLTSPLSSQSATQYFALSSRAIDEHFEFLNSVSSVLDELLISRSSKLRHEMNLTFLQAGFGFLVVCVIGLILIRDITSPLTSAVTFATKIADGDLSAKLERGGRSDEIGELMITLQKMSDGLQEQIRKILNGVNVLGSSSSQILASTSQVAAGATETAAAVTETTATVQEVRQTAQLSSQKAKDVADISQQSADISSTGTDSVNEMVAAMERIREQMSQISESVIRLSEQNQAIGDIINTVNDLAEQSNLLAVNAAIEAAKAGEQGKGFAVVAQEVKSLAEQSKQATTQVRTILNEVQKATGTAVMATEQGSKAVDAGLSQALDAGHSIQALADSIDGAAQAAMQIAASSQEQLIGVDQVALAMNNIKDASSQNVSSMRQLESAARDLNNVGAEMRQLVEQYRI